MVIALALPTKIHALFTTLGLGTLLFLVLLIVVGLNGGFAKPISRKRDIAICALCTAIVILWKTFSRL